VSHEICSCLCLRASPSTALLSHPLAKQARQGVQELGAPIVRVPTGSPMEALTAQRLAAMTRNASTVSPATFPMYFCSREWLGSWYIYCTACEAWTDDQHEVSDRHRKNASGWQSTPTSWTLSTRAPSQGFRLDGQSQIPLLGRRRVPIQAPRRPSCSQRQWQIPRVQVSRRPAQGLRQGPIPQCRHRPLRRLRRCL
jgi:hypothetical protein